MTAPSTGAPRLTILVPHQGLRSVSEAMERLLYHPIPGTAKPAGINQ